MGTRALIEVRDHKGKPRLTLYSQFDGYPDGGAVTSLLRKLANRRFVNGYRNEHEEINLLDSFLMLLAVGLYHEFHSPPEKCATLATGSAYIVPPVIEEDLHWIDYTYIIHTPDEDELVGKQAKNLRIEVWCFEDKIFEGTIEEFLTWAEKYSPES